MSCMSSIKKLISITRKVCSMTTSRASFQCQGDSVYLKLNMTNIDDSVSPLIVAFGIPTIDFSFLVSDRSMIEKYELNVDSQREIAGDLLDLLKLDCYEKKYQYKKTAGGNCQVSLMAFQSLMLEDRYQTVMCGAVGDDENGLFVRMYLNNKFIKTDFDVIRNGRTANCVIAVHRDLRTIAVTNGVGSEYSRPQCEHLEQKLHLASSSIVVLFEGFFVSFSYDIAVPIIQQCRKNGNIIALNISAVYIIEHFACQFLYCWKKCDILIGNLSEFDALCKALKLSKKPLRERLKVVQKMMLAAEKTGSERWKLSNKEQWKKILIVTNNKDPVHCVYGDGVLVEMEVPAVRDNEIVDTSGAGDSFLGGFLYGLIKQNTIEACLKLGCSVSSQVIRVHGYDL